MNARGTLLVVALGAAGCAQIIGADFDGLGPKESTGGGAGTGGASGTGGSAGIGEMGGAAGASGGAAGASGGMGTGGRAGTGGTTGTGGIMGTGGARDGGADARAGAGGTARPDAATGDASTRDAGVTDASVSDAHDTGVSRDASPDVASPADAAIPDAPIEPGDARGPLIVINEIRAVDADWIELYNPGPGTASLDGIGLTQAQGTNGPPDSTALLAFPAGTRVPAGSFLLVVGKQSSIGGPFTDCAGLASSCYWVNWGVSASGGESVYLVSVSSALPILATVTYPMASQAPPSGKSFGRLPDGTGAFTSTTPTPAAANQP